MEAGAARALTQDRRDLGRRQGRDRQAAANVPADLAGFEAVQSRLRSTWDKHETIAVQLTASYHRRRMLGPHPNT
jgi:hypothetical protein